jgi:hypothetical protein
MPHVSQHSIFVPRASRDSSRHFSLSVIFIIHHSSSFDNDTECVLLVNCGSLFGRNTILLQWTPNAQHLVSITMVRLSLCNQSSFCAENEKVSIIPSFNYYNSIPLISSPDQSDVGPFQAGLPTIVPLWIAKTLHQRKLAQIELPEWLASEHKLVEILQEERETVLLTDQLPFYYYEIARSLNFCVPKQTQVVLQDVVALRGDKLRQHFHELSRTVLQEQPNMDDVDDDDQAHELPMISVQGIGSHEINKIGPFLQRVCSDYGFLTKRAVDEGLNKAAPSHRRSTSFSASGEDDLGKDTMSQESKKASIARNRLRRFRS